MFLWNNPDIAILKRSKSNEVIKTLLIMKINKMDTKVKIKIKKEYLFT